jgi:hypothetical protein
MPTLKGYSIKSFYMKKATKKKFYEMAFYEMTWRQNMGKTKQKCGKANKKKEFSSFKFHAMRVMIELSFFAKC